MTGHDVSFQLTTPTSQFDTPQKVGMALMGVGLLGLVVALFGAGSAFPVASFWVSIGGLTLGGAIYFRTYLKRPAGIDNDGLWFSSATARGMLGWIFGIVFTGFYIILYWAPSNLEHLIRMTDPLSWVMRGRAADQWFLYGFFYTLAVLVMGARMIIKYRHNRYQILRTISVMFFQAPAVMSVGVETPLKLKFMNPLPCPLTGCYWTIEGPGLQSPRLS